MTTEQRFEIIESTLVEVVKIQSRQAESSEQLNQMFSRYVDRTDARMTRIEENLGRVGESLGPLAGNVGQLAENAGRLQENMGRIEENLDGLIRALTADHTNGKGKHYP